MPETSNSNVGRNTGVAALPTELLLVSVAYVVEVEFDPHRKHQQCTEVYKSVSELSSYRPCFLN